MNSIDLLILLCFKFVSVRSLFWSGSDKKVVEKWLSTMTDSPLCTCACRCLPPPFLSLDRAPSTTRESPWNSPSLELNSISQVRPRTPSRTTSTSRSGEQGATWRWRSATLTNSRLTPASASKKTMTCPYWPFVFTLPRVHFLVCRGSEEPWFSRVSFFAHESFAWRFITAITCDVIITCFSVSRWCVSLL